MATRMQQRRGTASQWSSANPILNVAEIGFETDTNKFKIGDGTNHWADLTYFVDAGQLADIVDGAPALLDTLNELAAAIGDDPSFMTTVATNLSNHASDTTSVHGITDTSLLVTTTGTETLSNKTIADPTILVGQSPSQVSISATEIGYLDGVTSAIQTQLDGKQAVVSGVSSTEIGYLDGVTSAIQTQLNNKLEAADIADFATESYVDTAVTNLIGGAPGALDTLNELAAAINDDASYASTITTALGNKQDKVSGVSDTEIGYLDGVTSAIQTQLDAKIAKSVVDAEGDLLIGTADNAVGRLAIGSNGYLLTSNGTTAEWQPAPASGPTVEEIVMGVW